MIDDDLRARFDDLASRATVPTDPTRSVRTRAARLRRRRRASASVAALFSIAVLAGGVALQAGGSTPATGQPADGVVSRSCDRAAFALAAQLGPIQAEYAVRLTAGAAARWIDPATFRPDPTLAALPAAQQVSFCLVVGDLDQLTQPDPPTAATTPPAYVSDAHVALVTVIDGKASARYIGGPDYSRLPEQPGPGIHKSAVAAFVVLNGMTVASAAPAQVAATPRCGSGDLSTQLTYDADVDGLPQWSVTVENVGARSCSMFGMLTLKALDHAGGPLPLPTDGALGRTRVSGVLLPHGASHLRATIYGDTSTNLCSRGDVVTPSLLVLTVGDVTMSVANHATTTVASRAAVSGCPNRIYVGSAEIG